ncbi:ArsA family ATPase [Raoultibacter phocaeensis]|uniref:ArsA family ATPase n=1 Tax=Raoultibacter phocaeensis TaxID=2479841 RepID=UPI00111AB094|nr:ArsA family ATPase [Raoultibacter phocaeensis]
MAKIRIFTGKGGVGKTSVAAASAWKAAKAGERTLLVSTDAAHSVGDVLDRRIGPEAVPVEENLEAVELDADRIMECEYGDLVRGITAMMGSMEFGGEPDEALPSMPGLDGLFSLLKLLDYAESGAYDTIVVDCAPTGETLALLKFPELMGWYVEKWLPLGKVAMRVLSPVSKKILKVELPDKHAMSDIERLYARLLDLQELLKDGERTSVRIVALPEKMVVEETKRNYLYLNLFGYRVDGLIVNRVLPAEAGEGFFSEWASVQKRCIEELSRVFGNLPQAQLAWHETDLCGLRDVARLSDELPDDAVFAAALQVEHERYSRTDAGWCLELFVPLAEKGGMELYRAGADLVVRIGAFNRSIPLPNALAGLDVVRAKLDNGVLAVDFAKEESDER